MRIISDGRAFIWGEDCLYTPYIFSVTLDEKKKERTKKERRKKRNNKIKIFAFDFLDCEEKSWDSGAVLNIRIAKGFHL